MKRIILLLFVGLLLPGLISPAEELKDVKTDKLAGEIEGLIKQLDDDDWATREKAQEKLEDIGPSAESAVKEATQSLSPEVRIRASLIMKIVTIKKRIIFSDKFIKLFEELYQPDAYRELLMMDSRQKFKTLVKITTYQNDDFKYKDRVTDKDIAGLVGEVLLDGGKGLRRGEKEIIFGICAGEHLWSRAGQGWRVPLPETLPDIKRLLKDKDTRGHAVAVLAKIDKKEDLVPRLFEFLEDEDGHVREHAAEALAELGVKKAIPDLMKLLEDNTRWVREGAMNALATLGAKKAIPEIEKLLDDQETDVRAWAGIALIELDAKDKVPEKIALDMRSIIKWGGRYKKRAEAAIKELEGTDKEEIIK